MTLSKFQFSRKLNGSTVLLRLDLNVPIERRQILDDTRIRAALPTIQTLVKRNATVVIISHLGRPGGRRDMKYTLAPVTTRLSELLDQPVKFVETGTIAGIKRSIRSLKQGQVAMLENIRFHKEEVRGDAWFGEALASLGDVYVFDGFGVAHRSTPSVTGIAEHVSDKYIGYLMQRELAAFDQLFQTPTKDTIGVVGGAKIETKLPLIEGMLRTCGRILVGGALVNTYLKAKGYSVGESLVNPDFEFAALQCMKHKEVVTPIDVIVGNNNGLHYRVADVDTHDRLLALPDEMILDIGPKTIQLYQRHLKKAHAIVWNGAMGYFEQPPYHIGTMAIAQTIAQCTSQSVYTMIGGGETIQSMQETGMMDRISHVSTGGGAMLEYLQHGTLPALEALQQN